MLTACDLSPLIATYFSISFNFSFSYPLSIYKSSRKINDCPDGENVSKQTKEVLEIQPGLLVSLLPDMGKITQWYPACFLTRQESSSFILHWLQNSLLFTAHGQEKILHFSIKLKGPNYNVGVEFWAHIYHSLQVRRENLMVNTFSNKNRCTTEDEEKEKWICLK